MATKGRRSGMRLKPRTSSGVRRRRIMPIDLPVDETAFHMLLRRRIRDQDVIDSFRATAKAQQQSGGGSGGGGGGGGGSVARKPLVDKPRHVVGQTGCFCLDCLVHRKQEWRLGDVNTSVVGPRDQWRQLTWGDAERHALGPVVANDAATQPVQTPAVRERIVVRDSRQRPHSMERDAKFTAVASGKYHTLLLSESAGVFSCGDNSYGAVAASASVSERATPTRVDLGHANGRVQLIAASAYASFALVALPPIDGKPTKPTQETRAVSRLGLMRRKSIDDVLGHHNPDQVVYNQLVSWGRGDRGVLGHGTTASSSAPKTIELFNTLRVLQVSAGAQHVLVLTEMDGVYAFGDGSHGKLGLGDTGDRLSPMRIHGLDGLHVIHVSAGGDHSLAVAGETIANRQVYSWGLGKNGRLGHNDDQSRVTPTRINHFRGRKVVTVVAGGAHNLATSDMSNGVCVWSWGAGTYGQLGHRDTWDAWLPRSIDEIRREGIHFIDAGEHHSIAISETRQLWLWGKGIHGKAEIDKVDPASSCIVQPVTVELSGIQIVSAKAGRGRSFVWGDRAIDKKQMTRTFGGSLASKVCCALPVFESLTSDSFRIVYRCGGCDLDEICIACAHRCHVQHCLDLGWTLENTLSRDCACFASGKCLFDLERGADAGANEVLED